MKRLLSTAFAVVALAGTGAITTAGSASATDQPAAVRTVNLKGCKTWNDKNTFGANCSGSRSFLALARCKNGRVVQGAEAYPGTWSYAYCSSVGSSLKTPVSSNSWVAYK
ncbi:hypothetical protein [Streptomyces griseocarneus]|uniref:hypothetical protein n=1 Tax=Streptomyces griseocarneus TaxID=51201 RepID=UPI00167CCFFE|nr:hypothetical protein [Streptomyces griseocarneus]MBZ6478121.1 hypothetical protein [Streptomyces griseocarneus]GHG83575.1 hypothetical protein GCM10018779_66720 [Streptomyces griseocarneus]